jgi:hypothetical protein
MGFRHRFEFGLAWRTLVLAGALWYADSSNAGEFLGWPPFDDGNIHLRKREFGRQHQTGRAASHEHDIVR